MHDILERIRRLLHTFSSHFALFAKFFFFYLRKKVMVFSMHFEKSKNYLVKFFMMKRGRYNRPFLHITTMSILGIGVLVGPFLADTYPIFSSNSASVLGVQASQAQQQSITVGENVFHTQESEKPRDKTLTYTVEKGDTVSTIAKKFGISEDTIRWQNNLLNDNLSIGDTLEILPVTGIAHKVASGDTIYSIAKKYTTDAQAIADFPFNEFANPEKFTLVAGQIVVVPDGVKPSEKPTIRRQVYLATGPLPVSGGGFTFPVRGEISQFSSWYHTALDIAAPYGTPIVAAHSGTVTVVSTGTYDGGYGNNVWISNGDGTDTHYAHMSAVNVSVGQALTGGSSVVGWIGLTGRTTGAHLHFEIRKNGVLVNPLPYVQ